MHNNFSNFLIAFSTNPPASGEAIAAAQISFDNELPDDYLQFQILHNGGEGFVGLHYLVIFQVEELCKINEVHQTELYAPGLLIFGSSGGGDAFCFDMQTTPPRVVQVPFIGLSRQDGFVVAGSFTELLVRMAEIDGPLF